MIHEHKPEAGDTRQRARQIYWATLCAVFFGFGLGHLSPNWVFLLWPLVSALAVQAADWACRFCGVSHEGRKHQIIQRDARAALVPFLSEAPVFEIKELFWRKVRVDREGIEAKHSDGKWKRVLWRDVETCTFVATRNVVGDDTDAGLMLQGSREMPLLQIFLSPPDAEKLLPAIRFYLRGESTEQDPPGPAL